MPKRIFVLLLGATLALTACEKRDITPDQDSQSDESRDPESTEDNADSDDQDPKGGTDKPSSDDEETGVEGPADDDSQDASASKDQAAASWKTCTDGAKRAYLCTFDGGGAAICVSEGFVELRLARPDGSESVHRHTGGDTKSVEQCQFTSPHRTDMSLTFYEPGQRLMFETHYVNPKSGYADGADGSTRGTVTIRPTGGDDQTWTCDELAEEDVGVTETSAAVALRDMQGETCDTVRGPTSAAVRGSTHQNRTDRAPECGGAPAPQGFVERAASANIEHLRFSADNQSAARDERATFTVASFETSGDTYSEPIASCAGFFARVRDQAEPSTLGAAPFQVQVDFWHLRYDGHTIVDGVRDVCRDYCQDAAARPGDFTSAALEVLSHVGPIFSYSRSDSEAAAGGPPYHGDSWGAVDLRTMQPAALDALITPESILEALRHDSVVRRDQTLSREIAEAESLDAALAAMEDSIGATGAYAFHYYNAREELVAMRIAFREDTAGLSANHMSEIGIWVKPKKAWIPAFEAARSGPGGGFYMSNYRMSF